MRLWISVLVLAAALVSRPGIASADLITFEPDDFAPGTDVTHASPGLTLFRITSHDPLAVMPTFVGQDPHCLTGPCSAVTGSRSFGGYSAFASLLDFCVRNAFTGTNPESTRCSTEADMSGLWMVFDTGADFVEIAGAWFSDFTWMKAYDENFQEVDRQVVPEIVLPRDESGFTKGFSNVTAPAGNIKYVLASSVGGSVFFDRIRYETVPEPSTLLLCGVGFVGLLRSRHRARR
jgi:hypothetical protein